MRAEIKEVEYRKTIEKIKETKIGFLKWSTNWQSFSWTERKIERERNTQKTNIRNESRGITKNLTRS